MTHGRIMGIVFLLLLLLAAVGRPCSLVSCMNGGIEVRRDFSVLVKHEGKPLQGVTVAIKTNLGAILSTYTTDAAGKASVTNLSPGEYWLYADFLGIGAASHCFHVAQQPSAKAKRVMKYDWADFAPSVRHPAGVVVDSQPGTGGTPLWNVAHPVTVPIASAVLQLQNAKTREIFTAISDQHGEFQFGSVPDGTYVLHVQGGTGREYDPTDVLVNVRASASKVAVVLTREETGCGDVWLAARWP